MRYRYLRFPGGKFKAVTFSYDDGVLPDIRLAKLFSERGLKCTFNINSALIGGSGRNARRLTEEEIREHLDNGTFEEYRQKQSEVLGKRI